MPKIMAFIRQAIEEKTKANSGEPLRAMLKENPSRIQKGAVLIVGASRQ